MPIKEYDWNPIRRMGIFHWNQCQLQKLLKIASFGQNMWIWSLIRCKQDLNIHKLTNYMSSRGISVILDSSHFLWQNYQIISFRDVPKKTTLT